MQLHESIKIESMKRYNIAVAGTGYVGMSIATLLAQHNHVTAVDVLPDKVDKINNRISPIQDDYIEKYLAEKELDLTGTLDGAEAYRNADFVVIAAPTNYNPVKNYFDTHCIEDVIDLVLSVNPDAVMVIKSTIPVGYCRSLYVKYAAKGVKQFNLLFFPEFLRESKALYDNLYPSRIIAGIPKVIDRPEFAEENTAILAVTDIERMDDAAHMFANLLQQGAIKEEIPTLYMGMKEAEAVKLFANTYLALRVSYFNEQPLLRLRRLLSAQRLEAAPCQLRRRATKHDERHSREQPHPQRLHRRPGTQNGRLLYSLKPLGRTA